MNKELIYAGSLFPICSIIRTRKFIKRGWNINAGQFLKMSLQVSKLNLSQFHVLKDQLIGVDASYFNQILDNFENGKEIDGDYIYMLFFSVVDVQTMSIQILLQ